MKKLLSILLCLLLLAGCAEPYDGPTSAKRVCTRSEMEVFNPDGSHSHWYREEYAYDLYGNRTQVLSYHNDELAEKSILRYDDQGNVLRQDSYAGGSWLPFPSYTYTYTYDDRGRQISSTNRHGWEKSTVTTVYDDEAMTRTVTGYGNVAVDYLNEQGWVLRTEQTFSDGRFILTEYERSAEGWLLGARSWENGVLTSESVLTYDDQGRILTQTEIEDGVSTLLFAWEYGENRETMFYSDGASNTVVYHDDGTMQCQYRTEADGHLVSETFYYYTEIQVPAEEVSP